MSATAGQTVAFLSLDSEYRQWHRDTVVSEATDLNRVWKRRGVQNVSEIVLRPVRDILLGVAMGASGLIISPYKGLKKNGKWGFVQGVATGTAGVVAKPLVGVLDAFTHFSSTVHDVARSANVLERRFQPALKLRLPYSFGPMKILLPFDVVTARSVDLLKMFPPKAKRSKTQGGRSTEFHVHSEVLYMEPGVETYAIVSTIRVVLIKFKKDNNGMSPSFGWEVSLGRDVPVSSLLSDHGHNGVALTITKRAEDRDMHGALLFDKDRHGQRNSQTGGAKLNSMSLPSSAFSVDSRYSYTDSEDPDVLHQPESEDSAFNHGSTRKGGEILEWFTVVAEFQHRVQLTKLHNSISCVVGDFDAIIVDHAGDLEQRYKGATTFGLFTFEESHQDSKIFSPASNADLVAALEHLPWMHDATFKMIQTISRRQQAAEVSRIRRSWIFANELEASMIQGGPQWLVEARARAMFVPVDPPIVPECLDPHDTVVKKVYQELEQGNISSEQASKLLESHAGDTLDYEDIQEDDGNFFAGFLDEDTGEFTPNVVEFDAIASELKDPEVANQGIQEIDSPDKLDSIKVPDSRSSGRASLHAMVSNGRPDSGTGIQRTSRIDRIESLMEQLIQLNAHQAAQKAVPYEVFSETHSCNQESRIADSVIHELTELRSQVQVRVKEDEDLRKEIALLRQQLADGRGEVNTVARNRIRKSPKKRGLKIPEILGFGKLRKPFQDERTLSLDQGQTPVLPLGEMELLGTDSFDEMRIPLSGNSAANQNTSSRKSVDQKIRDRRFPASMDMSIASVDRSVDEMSVSRRSSSWDYGMTHPSLSIERSNDSIGILSKSHAQNARGRRRTRDHIERQRSTLSAGRSVNSIESVPLQREPSSIGHSFVFKNEAKIKRKKKGRKISKMFQFLKKKGTDERG
jgi:hypothetical protein